MTLQKNKSGENKAESNDSPEIPDRGETSDIPSLPSLSETQTLDVMDLSPQKFLQQNILSVADKHKSYCMSRGGTINPNFTVRKLKPQGKLIQSFQPTPENNKWCYEYDGKV